MYRVWVPTEPADDNDDQVLWVAAEITKQQAGAGMCTCVSVTGQELLIDREKLEMREVLPDDGNPN
eukprot:SAG31_NODE_23127_length_510_cov_1.399027_1_plen_66_part_00